MLACFSKTLKEVKTPHWVAAGCHISNKYYSCHYSMVVQLKQYLNQGHVHITCHYPTAAVTADHVLFSYSYVINLPALCACYDAHVFLLWIWGTVRQLAPAAAYLCISKCWYLEGMLRFTSKGRIFFSWPTFSPERSSLSRPPTPRYIFHVLKNSIAPSPIVQARHLDRLEPHTRSQWIKEWRSLRGGGTVKRSRISTPPSPTLDTPVDVAHFSSAAPVISDGMMNEFTLNVIAESSKEEAQTCLWEMDLFSSWGIIYYL